MISASPKIMAATWTIGRMQEFCPCKETVIACLERFQILVSIGKSGSCIADTPGFRTSLAHFFQTAKGQVLPMMNYM
jgi:hypothetical protein